MKIVELKIDDSLIAGIDAVALVESPAIEQDFLAFNKQYFESYNDYPQAAVDAAIQGIKRNEAIDNKCATQVGKVRAQQLANREPVTIDTIKRMRSFLIRQKDNYELAQSRKDYNACGYISYLLWGGPAALPWAEKKLRQAGIEFKDEIQQNFDIEKFIVEEIIRQEMAEIGPRGGVKASPKAPKSDTKNPTPKGEGTAKGDASTTRGAKVDKQTEQTLKDKSDDFNEKYKDKLGYGVNVGMLKSVYQRGLGAYNTSRSPEVASRGGAKQWALARVNAFLYLVKNGRPQNKKYTTDYDLLPTKHPKREEMTLIMDEMGINVSGLPDYVGTGSMAKVGTPGPNFYDNKFSKQLSEKQMLVGPLMTANKLIPRVDEEGNEYFVYFTEDTIEKLAYKMMEDKLVDSVNIEHDGDQKVDDVYLVETWLVKDPENDKANLYGYQPQKGDWFGIYKVKNSNIWNEYVKTGKVKGFSVEGFFTQRILMNSMIANLSDSSEHSDDE